MDTPGREGQTGEEIPEEGKSHATYNHSSPPPSQHSQGSGWPSAPACGWSQGGWPVGGANWPPIVGPWYLGPRGFFMMPQWSPRSWTQESSSLAPEVEVGKDCESKLLHKEQLNQSLVHIESLEQVVSELNCFKKKMQMSSAQLYTELRQVQDHTNRAQQLHEEGIQAIDRILQLFPNQDSMEGDISEKENMPDALLRKNSDKLWDKSEKHDAASLDEASEITSVLPIVSPSSANVCSRRPCTVSSAPPLKPYASSKDARRKALVIEGNANASSAQQQDFERIEVNSPAFERTDIAESMDSQVRESVHQKKTGETDTIEHSDAQDREASSKDEPKPWFIVLPTDWRRMTWDSIALLIIFVEAIILPLEIGLNMKFPIAWFWFSTVFFSVDLLLNCVTAYVNKAGEIITIPKLVVQNYLFSIWFPIDLISTLPWQLMFVESDENTTKALRRSRMLKLTKIAKGLRILRVLRAFRVMKLLAHYQTIVTRPGTRATFKLFFLFLSFVYTLHICACVWALIGAQYEEEHHPGEDCIPGGPCEIGVDGSAWIKRYNQMSKSLEELYIISAYHSSAHMISSVVEITPGNDAERLHVIICQIFNFFFCAYILAVFVKIVMTHDAQNEEFTHDLNNLRELIVSRRIPLSLRIKVERYLEWRQNSKHKAVSYYDGFLEHLSPSLRGELKLALFGETLMRHAFFSQLPQQALLEICKQSGTVDAAPGDTVVEAGQTMNAMLGILDGELKIIGDSKSENAWQTLQRTNTNNTLSGLTLLTPVEQDGGQQGILGPGRWIGSLCLFHSQAVCHPKIVAMKYSEMVAVTAENVQCMLRIVPAVRPVFENMRKLAETHQDVTGTIAGA